MATQKIDPNLPSSATASVQTIDDAGYHEVQTGFNPYFSPKAGAKFKGTLVDVDAKDPEFIRFTFVAETDLECFTGPNDDQESVIVKAGEAFNVSSYSQVAFEDYGGMSIIVEFTEKVKTATAGRSVWKMRLKVAEADYKILQERKMAEMRTKVAAAKQLRASAEKAKQLPA